MAKKLYYKIGEACKRLEIQPYVLRYWETEFPFLSPNKSKSGQRVYSEHEIEVIRRIKELLYEEGYTIAGAKKKLEAELSAQHGDADSAPVPAPAAAGRAPGRKGSGRAKKAAAAGGESDRELTAEHLQQLERLRSGVEGALGKARAILDLLSSPFQVTSTPRGGKSKPKG